MEYMASEGSGRNRCVNAEVAINSLFAAPAPVLRELVAAGRRVAEAVVRKRDLANSYTRDLTLEALLEFSRATGEPQWATFVAEVCRARGITPDAEISWCVQPFSCLTLELWEHTHDEAWLPVFVKQSRLWMKEKARSADGLTLHPRGEQRGGGFAVLIDDLQCYAYRMAATGRITGEEAFFDECVEQYCRHRALLRSPATGLWSQGRGWLAPGDERLSPGAWSRGHGWLMRGMEKSLAHLPAGSPWAGQMMEWLRELSDTLLALQAEEGVWHTLLNRPRSESLPDSSGTGMIAVHLARAWTGGWLPDSRYRDAALKAFAALPRLVREDGAVLLASPGPGPLETEEPWLAKSFPPGDGHGTFAVLFAAATAAAPLS